MTIFFAAARRSRSSTALGSAPYPTKSPRMTTRSNFRRARAREHGREGLVVGVDVGQEQIAHGASELRSRFQRFRIESVEHAVRGLLD